MPDELLDKLGTYFVYHNVRERLCITFEQFIRIYESGRWEEYVG